MLCDHLCLFQQRLLCCVNISGYPPPPPELLADICKRLNELPPELAQQVDQDLKTKSIEHVGNFLWRAGFPFTTLSAKLHG
jgi:hypothetical protein